MDAQTAIGVLQSSSEPSELMQAISRLGPETGAGRDAALYELLAAHAANESVLERAALELGKSRNPRMASLVRQLAASERSAGLRYALTQAAEGIQKHGNEPGKDLAVRLSPAGFEGSLSGVLNVTARTETEGFVRIGIHLPPSLELVSGEDRWEGLMQPGDSRALAPVLRASQDGIYYVRVTFWLRAPGGSGFKGGSQIRDEVAAIRVGNPARGSGSMNAIREVPGRER